jgi:chloramphenicol-sensitive protein RarD
MNRRGLWFAAGAYITWGLFPLYWRGLAGVPALQLLGNRVVWSFVFMLGILFAQRQWRDFRVAAAGRRVLGIYSLAAVLIALNWLIYVWAVTSGYVVESSLGYFINPLLSVLLGMIFFGERLRAGQWLPLGLAAAGVAYLAYTYGSLPWIALSLAFSFGFYGLVKKKAPLSSAHGLTVETGVLFLPALAYLAYCDANGTGALFHSDTISNLLLVGAGMVTVVPLLMFASAVRLIPLSVVGLMQYIAPTLQFLLGVLVFKEAFTRPMAIGFTMIWLALIIFWVEGYRTNRLANLQRAVAPIAD